MSLQNCLAQCKQCTSTKGTRLKRGQLLLELDPQKRQLALQQSEQQVNRTRAALEEAQLKLQRRRNLSEQETISKEVLDNAQLTVDAATATYQQALVSQQLAEARTGRYAYF